MPELPHEECVSLSRKIAQTKEWHKHERFKNRWTIFSKRMMMFAPGDRVIPSKNWKEDKDVRFYIIGSYRSYTPGFWVLKSDGEQVRKTHIRHYIDPKILHWNNGMILKMIAPVRKTACDVRAADRNLEGLKRNHEWILSPYSYTSVKAPTQEEISTASKRAKELKKQLIGEVRLLADAIEEAVGEDCGIIRALRTRCGVSTLIQILDTISSSPRK